MTSSFTLLPISSLISLTISIGLFLGSSNFQSKIFGKKSVGQDSFSMMFNGSWMNPMFQVQNITGSINLKSTILNSIASQIKVSLSDAAATAEKQVGNNSHAVAGHLGVSNGYLVYTISISDPDANIHWVVIDAGNGKVLSSLKLPWQNMMMFGGMMGMMGPNMMGNLMMNPSMMGMMGPNMMGNLMMNPSMMGMMGPSMMGNMMGFR